jgi:gas vesicle protein
MTMNKDSSSGFFSGLLVGAVIGAAIGLLYAPQSGNETRRLVKEKAVETKGTLVKAAARVKETMAKKMGKETDS